jgi:hypothetical protein
MAEEFERRSPIFDWDKGDFAQNPDGSVKTATQGAAAEQIIVKALQTPRARFLIYANLEDEDLDHKYGSDVPDILRDYTISQEVKKDEVQRAIADALMYLDWVESVENVTFAVIDGEIGAIEANFDVLTIWDEVISMQGVTIING